MVMIALAVAGCGARAEYQLGFGLALVVASVPISDRLIEENRGTVGDVGPGAVLYVVLAASMLTAGIASASAGVLNLLVEGEPDPQYARDAQLVGLIRQAARDGRCPAVQVMQKRLNVTNPTLAQMLSTNDPNVAVCLSTP